MSLTQSHVLVIDDEADLRSLLQRYLGDQGFNVTVRADARDIERTIKAERVDLLVLDLMMPGESGLSICQRLRAAGDTTPIIMLTAKGDPVDRIVGLESGADDYLAKPFTPRELVARIHAQLRRREMDRMQATADVRAALQFGPYRLDFSTRELTRDGQRVALSSVEFLVLKALALHPNQELSRDRLIDLSKGVEAAATDRSIDVQVLRLRRAIEDDPSTPRWIKTVRGVGYVFVPNAPP